MSVPRPPFPPRAQIDFEEERSLGSRQAGGVTNKRGRLVLLCQQGADGTSVRRFFRFKPHLPSLTKRNRLSYEEEMPHTPTTSHATRHSGPRLPPSGLSYRFLLLYCRYYRFTMQRHSSLSDGNFAKLLSASLTVQILHVCLETIRSSEGNNTDPARSFSATSA